MMLIISEYILEILMNGFQEHTSISFCVVYLWDSNYSLPLLLQPFP